MNLTEKRTGYPKIKGIIAERGLKQNEISTALGIDRSTLSFKLNGYQGRDFTLNEAYKLSTILKVKVDDFF